MLYSSIERIRSASGVANNPDITDDTIRMYQEDANAVINAKISKVYNLSTFQYNFQGSSAHNLLKNIETLMAAGHLKNDNFGSQSLNTVKEGNGQIEEAYKLLDAIVSGTLILVDTTGNEYTYLRLTSGYPTTADTRIFVDPINQKY